MGKEQSKYTAAIGIFPRKMLQSILIGAFILLLFGSGEINHSGSGENNQLKYWWCSQPPVFT
jgi:hypothetical protein